MKSVYLAGPDVFRLDAIEHGKYLKYICHENGLNGVFPLDNNIPAEVLASGKHEIAKWIRLANEELIRGCDAVLANMTPFRGVSMDVGTAYEMGFASALNIPVFSYSEDSRKYIDKIVESGLVEGHKDGFLIDQDRMTVEDFDHRDNLMMVAGHPDVADSFLEAVLNANRFFDGYQVVELVSI